MTSRLGLFLLFVAAVLVLEARAISPGPPGERAQSLILSEVKLKDATLDEAVAYLKAALHKPGLFEDAHVNIVVLGAPKQGARITLDLRDVPARLAFEQVAQIVGMKLRIEANALVFVPLTSAEPIHTRIYRVPPDFIQTGSAAK
jgi:hypothetical protein